MNKGGRPKNAWTPSRKRKLARLHTLTTLDKDEIAEVLRAHGFKPSPSDVQKKLRDLLPRDYAKEYNSIRPPKDHPRSFRLDKLRKQLHYQPSMHPHDARAKFKDVQAFEGPSSAFRDYSGPNPIQLPRTLIGTAQDEPESQIVIPSLLLLDGSFIVPTIEEDLESTHVEQTPKTKSTPIISRASSVLSLSQLESRIKRSSSLIRHVQAVLRHSSTNSWRSSLSLRCSEVSAQSLMRVRGVVISILRSRPASETEQNAPALSIAGNIVPSCEGQLLESDASAVLESAPPNEASLDPPEQQRPPTPIQPTYPKSPSLSETEERIWHEMIQESGLNSPFSARPEFTGMCLQWRICCQEWVKRRKPMCRGCGLRDIHRQAKLNTSHILSSGNEETSILSETTNQADYFGNTPLHFAAGSPTWQIGYMMNRIGDSAATTMVNTSGSTFLHVLFEYLRSSVALRDVVPVVRCLASQDFPFTLRDCHGRTAIHMLFDNRHRLLERLFSWKDHDTLLYILDIMQLGNNTLMDNLGRNIDDLIRHDTTPGQRKPDAAGYSFIGAMSELSSDPTKWLLSTVATDKYSWIDSNGDTALIALIKSWNADKDETQLPDIIQKLVQSGSAVDMRDRAGNTALAIATRRGLRPAVTALLNLGACIHSRNYLGVSILRGARRELRQTRRDEEDKLYAMILSCITLLVDKGAVMHPSGYQEWAAPSSPLAQDPLLHTEVLALQNRHNRDNTNIDLMSGLSYL